MSVEECIPAPPKSRRDVILVEECILTLPSRRDVILVEECIPTLPSRRDVMSVEECIPTQPKSRRDVILVEEHIPALPKSRRDVMSVEEHYIPNGLDFQAYYANLSSVGGTTKQSGKKQQKLYLFNNVISEN